MDPMKPPLNVPGPPWSSSTGIPSACASVSPAPPRSPGSRAGGAAGRSTRCAPPSSGDDEPGRPSATRRNPSRYRRPPGGRRGAARARLPPARPRCRGRTGRPATTVTKSKAAAGNASRAASPGWTSTRSASPSRAMRTRAASSISGLSSIPTMRPSGPDVAPQLAREKGRPAADVETALAGPGAQHRAHPRALAADRRRGVDDFEPCDLARAELRSHSSPSISGSDLALRTLPSPGRIRVRPDRPMAKSDPRTGIVHATREIGERHRPAS